MQKLVSGKLVDMTPEEINQREADNIAHDKAVAKQAILDSLAEQQKILDDTDWYLVRKYETGVAIPVDVTNDRVSARTQIDSLRLQLGN